MLNGLTIDVEDWRQLLHWKATGEIISPSPIVVEETEALLEILAHYEVQATFFVLGNVAEVFPELIRLIRANGHEIGSHGYSHELVHRQTPEEFRQEIRVSKALLERILGEPIHGYRAAEFSITRNSWWAFDILADEGFAYDSSIFPIPGRRYGVPGAPLYPHFIETQSCCPIYEFPLATLEWLGRRWPFGGGGYLRVLPGWVTQRAIARINQAGRPAVIYVHPYEFSQKQLELQILNANPKARWLVLRRYALLHNFARKHLQQCFVTLLRNFEFVPLRELMPNDRSG